MPDDRILTLRVVHQRLVRRENRWCAWCGRRLSRLQKGGRFCSARCQKRNSMAVGQRCSMALTKEEMAKLNDFLKRN